MPNKIYFSKIKSWKKVYGESIGPDDLLFLVKPKGKRLTKFEKAAQEFINAFAKQHADKLFKAAFEMYANELRYGTPVPPENFYGKGVIDEIDENYSPGGTI